ncbi:hypothetical protein [Bifidobacterium felsineum]|uniref:hypothetical protein n=1 Tax=Bifidobacterium felsineum TaxID=2045440 RepID=UPI001BDCB5FA|nr:hypothetical protein [Bifidobacterium felsineum]MBT1164644.1 hypothetical protein [Bifidobacterium felsineum]
MTMVLEPSRLPMSQTDIDHLFTSAVGYAVNRGTYATEGVFDALDVDGRLLSPDAARNLAAFIDDAAMGVNRPRWMALARRLETGEHDPSCVLSVNAIDRRILFFSAFRYDIESDDPSMPLLWERWCHDYPRVVYGRDRWNLLSARDLVWANLIPLDEPLDGIQSVGGRVEPVDGRWVRLFRMLRDGRGDE